MKQLIQNLRTGELGLKDVPVPLCKSGGVLVRTVSSLVSVGTEKSIIELANKSLLGKARARPDLFRRAVEKARKEGFLKVYRESKERLDEPFPLGYSASGVVVEVGKGVTDIHVGQPVAVCGGGFAAHAEYNYVPQNLCMPLPKKGDGKNISFQEGAFGMVGAIALHGLREAQVTPGETVLVIGLGLLGLLTLQLVNTMGCFSIGVEIDSEKIALARAMGTKHLFDSNDSGLEECVYSITKNKGVDATIITAATESNEPVEVAQRCTRAKGRIELVGVSKINLDRKYFWDKELSFSVSRGDGPGVGDDNYVVNGMDYPQEYVRWTKKRNAEYFLRLIAEDKVDVNPLVTHRYPFEDAETVYKRIQNGKEKVIGVLFDYPEHREYDIGSLRVKTYKGVVEGGAGERVIGLIGGGMFAKSTLLPVIKKLRHVKLKTIATTRGMTADHIAGKYGFHQSTTDYRNILDDPEIDSVIITTRHDSHARFVSETLQAGKNVFVEKPLCLNEEEMADIARVKMKHNQAILMVGYNRRFSPHISDVKKFFSHEHTESKIIDYRVNAGFIPKEHWTQDIETGGGRIIGEVCHFVDLCMYITGARPGVVYAHGISDSQRYLVDDNIVANIKFDDGSLASILYTSKGDKSYVRESMEIFSSGSIYCLNGFKKATRVRNGKRQNVNLWDKDVGHEREMELFLSGNVEELIGFEDIVLGMLATFSILESLKTGKPVDMKDRYSEFSNKMQ